MTNEEMVELLDAAIRNSKLVREQLKKRTRPERPDDPDRPDKPDLPPPPPDELPDLEEPQQFDWLCRPGYAVSTKTAARVSGSNSVGLAYREHMRDPNNAGKRFRAKVHGYCGYLQLAGGYNSMDSSVACWQDRAMSSWGDVDISLVGVPDTGASISLSIGGDQQYGFLRRFAAHALGIKGRRDSMVIRQHQAMSEFVLDGCHFESAEGVQHENGAHFSQDFDRVIVNGFRSLGFKCSYHLFYSKGGGELWCVDSDLFGGNRSGWQDRAEADWYGSIPPTSRPHGRRMFLNNYCADHGFNHEGADGGAVLSLYGNPDHETVLDGNSFTNCRYGGIYLIHRSDGYHDEDGYSFGKVVWKNGTCWSQDGQSDPDSARPAISISSVRELTFETWPDAKAPPGFADMILDDLWSKDQGAPPNGTVYFPEEPKPEDLYIV